ncbi:MAG: carbohydrate ABC transporter permease, partial [Pseudomonadales bacterium]|nr:carbohydrate ABC transporter permease [Pseudomonadales bacterium]
MKSFPIAQWLSKACFYLLLIAIGLYTIFPFYWAIVSSLKSGSALFQVEFWPSDPQWQNYLAVFRAQPFGRNIGNSILVAVSTVVMSLALSIFAAYAVGRIQFRGRMLLLFVILGVSMFPQIAVLSGMFELINSLGLYNNLLALSLSYLMFTLPFTVWVLTTFMRELPKELEEAAIVDGATPFMIVTRIFMPLMGPALVTTGLLAFIVAWNEFLFA